MTVSPDFSHTEVVEEHIEKRLLVVSLGVLHGLLAGVWPCLLAVVESSVGASIPECVGWPVLTRHWAPGGTDLVVIKDNGSSLGHRISKTFANISFRIPFVLFTCLEDERWCGQWSFGVSGRALQNSWIRASAKWVPPCQRERLEFLRLATQNWVSFWLLFEL